MTRHRSLLASFAVLATLAIGACGGAVEPGGSSQGGGTGSGVVGGTGGTGAMCVDINLATYDGSCNQASDCTLITAGLICDGDCACGGAAVNVSGQARYQSAISSIQLGLCGCPEEGVPECLDHVCTLCSGLPSDPPACQTQVVDAGAACVDIDLSTYDTSCQQDSDCADITAGTVCTDSCMCGGAAINTDGLGRYGAAIGTIGTSLACPCAFEGVVSCVANKCTICGFGPGQPVGCPDGG